MPKTIGGETVPDESYPFSIYSGLLTPDHYKNIGSALWLFLWCVSSTTKEVEKEGERWGIVLGNKPLKAEELREIFGVTDRTIRTWIRDLRDHDYVRTTRTPSGLILSVRKSKKFIKKGTEENFRSGDSERKKTPGERKKTSYRTEENFRSNKDITNDITSDYKKDVVVNMRARKEKDLEPVDHIADYYMVRHGKPGYAPRASDYKEIKSVMSSGVPLNDILHGIDQAFDEFKPSYPGDEISSFAYCKKVILSNFYRDNARKEAKNERTKPNSRRHSATEQDDYEDLSL